MRLEHDSLGEIAVPQDALWGAQTQRAIENFPISGQRFGRQFILALGWVKYAAAQANMDLGYLDAALGTAILQASQEVIAGQWDDQFPVDIFQTGSGTSTNMNANEVIANRAIQILGGEIGTKTPVHPNDHVNMSQSSNDIIPSAIHIAVTLSLRDLLVPSLHHLYLKLQEKAVSFDTIVKTGRTHLQDATPIRLGQVFGGYATQVQKSIQRAEQAILALRELPLGGTAVGTGLNCPSGFVDRVLSLLNAGIGTDFLEAVDHIEANAARDALVEVSGILKTIAISLHKIANDIRWLGSGPRNGLGELCLPPVQPGSSIMPGKVNPVLAEALIMACAQVVGYDTAVTLGGLGGNFELNTMLPLLAHNLLHAIILLGNAAQAFTDRCVAGLSANTAVCRENVARNLTLATALVPVIGYDRAAKISQTAYQTGRTIREVALEQNVLTEAELDRLLDGYQMTLSHHQE
ncbi:MAG: class II fumarate hydratase [Anaerolineae bacterium]|nr:class II fumarate hydratase [Anaerolineae bacterium]